MLIHLVFNIIQQKPNLIEPNTISHFYSERALHVLNGPRVLGKSGPNHRGPLVFELPAEISIG